MHITLDSAFNQLKLEEDSSFHPRRGSEHLRRSETWDFYVVTCGRVPGIYTHWRASLCTDAFHANRGPVDRHRQKASRGLTPSQPRQFRDATPASTSAPATPTGSRKNLLYVYSRGKDTTIYADQVSTAARRGWADGSFRKVEVTSGVRNVFDLAEESALECL
ncbi:hypothetical protein B0H14DRAFT_3500648 [Mycena olivaceomarginata]|nr:hypothetical protein B0H14DRAFT_3500648 [Mycena olivaceomarginata]